MTISSPASTNSGPQLCATRLIASVAPRTKMISLTSAALRKARVPLARFLELVGRALAQLVDAAMHVGVVAAVELGDAVDHRRRLLRAGAGIEKHQPRIVLIDRELAAQRLGDRAGFDSLSPPAGPAARRAGAADARGSPHRRRPRSARAGSLRPAAGAPPRSGCRGRADRTAPPRRGRRRWRHARI